MIWNVFISYYFIVRGVWISGSGSWHCVSYEKRDFFKYMFLRHKYNFNALCCEILQVLNAVNEMKVGRAVHN